MNKHSGPESPALEHYHGPYLFINTDAQKQRPTRAESYMISSHVSKVHRNWLRGKRLEQLKVSPSNALGQSSILPARSAVTWARCSQYRIFRIGAARHVSTNHERDGRPQNRRSGSPHVHLRASNPSLVAWLGNSDPFGAAALPLTPQLYEIIGLAQRFLVFSPWPNKAGFLYRVPNEDTANSQISLQAIMSSDAEIHAILAGGYQVAADIAANSEALTRWSCHKAQAVALLRQRLSEEGLSHSLATLIRLLIALDFQAGDHSAALVHLRGLWNVSQQTPAMQASVLPLLLISDMWIALSLLRKPEIPAQVYDPGGRRFQPFERALNRLESEISCGESAGLGTLNLDVILEPQTSSMLNAARENVDTKSILGHIEDAHLRLGVVEWMQGRGLVVAAVLLGVYTEAIEAAGSRDLDAPVVIKKYMNAACALCIILFMHLRFLDSSSCFDFSKTFQALEPALVHIADLISSAPTPELDKIYLWTLFMCALGNDFHAAKGAILYSSWPVREFHSVCKRLNIWDKGALVDVLRQFQYCPQMDDFASELLLMPSKAPVRNIIPWSRWRVVLDYHIP